MDTSHWNLPVNDSLWELRMKNYEEIADDNQMIAVANSVKDRLRRRADTVPQEPVKKSVRGAAIGTLNKYLGGDAMRRIVLSWLFAGDFEVVNERSSKTLSESQMEAIVEWIDWWQDEDGTWHVGERFPREAICVLNAAIRAYNRANRKEKMQVANEALESLVASMVELGGTVKEVTDDTEEMLSKIDKKGDIDEQDN